MSKIAAILCLSLSFNFTFLIGQVPSDFVYFKEITINASEVPGTNDLIDFPVLISTASGDNDLRSTTYGGKVNSSLGYDIIFTSSDGSTVYNHDIEGYYEDSGKIFMWVNIPTLSATSDTNVRMYFGGPDTDFSSSAFANDYKGVYHSDVSGNDFSTFNHDLSHSGGTDIEPNAPISDGVSLDGGASLNHPSDPDLMIQGDLTIEAWINVVNLEYELGGNYFTRPIVSYHGSDWRDEEDSNVSYNFGIYRGDLYFEHEYGDGNNERVYSTAQIEDSVWHHVAVTRNAATQEITFYYDGTQLGPSGTYANNPTGGVNADFQIGNNGAFIKENYYGEIDEVRISDVMKSPEWIQTSYNTAADPSAFYNLSNTSCNPNFIGAAPIANAGIDQVGNWLCGSNTATLDADVANVGIGLWTELTGDGAGSFIDNNDSKTTFQGTPGETYTLRWTVGFPPCTSAFDDVIVEFGLNPTAATAGPDQALCSGSTTTLYANTPSLGQGRWSIMPGSDGLGVIDNDLDPNSAFEGTIGEDYNLRWTITSGSCSTYDEALVQFNGINDANAGLDQLDIPACGSTFLDASNPPNSTGTWSITGGVDGLVKDPSLASSEFSGIPGETYTLRWLVTESGCADSEDFVTIRFAPITEKANAGENQLICSSATTAVFDLDAEPLVSGTSGGWSTIPVGEGTFANDSEPNTTFTGNTGDSYTLVWSVSGSSCAADTITLTSGSTSSTSFAADAGEDIIHCDATPVQLNNNFPSDAGINTSWTNLSNFAPVITSGGVSTLNGMSGETHVLVWAWTDGTCGSRDTVVVTYLNSTPTPADAGPDQVNGSLCGETSTTLAANASLYGEWSIVSGDGNGTFDDAKNPNTIFHGTNGEIYELNWAIDSGTCGVSDDDVTIQFDPMITPANAGPDQLGETNCGVTSTTLAALLPAGHSGQWTSSGGSFDDNKIPNATFTGSIGSSYALTWTTTLGNCTDSDNVIIEFSANTVIAADAGLDQVRCVDTSPCVKIQSDDFEVDYGKWIRTGSNDALRVGNNANSGMQNIRLRDGNGDDSAIWTDELDFSDYDSVSITFSFITEGYDDGEGFSIELYTGPGATTLSLTQDLVAGAGTADFENGIRGTGTFSISSVSLGQYNTIYFRSKGNAYTDAVFIDDIVIDGCRKKAPLVILDATPPATGTGEWSILSNNLPGTIANPTDPTSWFEGTLGGIYTLRWTTTEGGCEVYDDVDIRLLYEPYAEITLDPTECSVDRKLIGSNNPGSTVTWNHLSGTGTIVDPSSSTTDVTGLSTGTHVFEYVVTAGSCTDKDIIKVFVDSIAPVFTQVVRDTIFYRKADCSHDYSPSALHSLFVGTDACDDSPTISSALGSYFPYISVPCSNNEFRSVTTTISDAAGNSTTYTYTITILDTFPPDFSIPNFTGYRDNDCVLLDITPSATGSPALNSGACGSVSYSYSDDNGTSDCGGHIEIIRTWIGTDECGNATSEEQIITIRDTTPPAFTTPRDTILYFDTACGFDTTTTFTGGIEDVVENCGGTDKIDLSLISPNHQHVTGDSHKEDDKALYIPFEFETGVDIFTNQTLFELGDLDIGLEAMISAGQLNFYQVNVTGFAESIVTPQTLSPNTKYVFIIYRNAGGDWFLFFDQGGDISKLSSYHRINGINKGGELWNDGDIGLGDRESDSAISDVFPSGAFLGTSISATIDVYHDDDLSLFETGGGVEEKYNDIIANPCGQEITIKRVWTLTDACGNISVDTQYIEVRDTIKPTFTVPVQDTAWYNTTCGLDTLPASVGEVLIFDDNCSSISASMISYANNYVATPPSIERTWRVTDDCGNYSESVQTIILLDTIAPSITCPSDQSGNTDAACDYILPDYTPLVASTTDNCPVSDITYLQIPAAGTILDAGIHDISLIAEDAFGNRDTCNFKLDLDYSISTVKVLCGDTYIGASTIGQGNRTNTYSCIPFNTPGEEIYYQVDVPPGNYVMNVLISNVVDPNDTEIEILWMGSTCPINNCETYTTYNIGTQTFANGTNKERFVAIGPDTYYIVLDSKKDGITSFDIEFECFDSLIELDRSDGCAADTDNDGVVPTVNTSADLEMYPCETVTICQDIYIKNVHAGEWLDSVQMILSSCYTNVSGFTPSGVSSGFYNSGEWVSQYDAGSNIVTWEFADDAGLGRGDGFGYTYGCDSSDTHVYTFCFTAEIDADCAYDSLLNISIVVADDEIDGLGRNTGPGVDEALMDDYMIADSLYIADGDTLYFNCDQDTISVANPSPSLVYNWKTADGNIVSRSDSMAIIIDAAGTYIVESNAPSCIYTDTIVVMSDANDPTFTAPRDTTLARYAGCYVDTTIVGAGDVIDEMDNSGVPLEATYSDNIVSTCEGDMTITRTWTLEDDCGNITSRDQIITVIDTLAPTFDVPVDVTVSYNAMCELDSTTVDLLLPTNLADNCDATLSSSYYDKVISANLVHRIWTVEDDCGNVARDTQSINITDSNPPDVTCPGEQIISLTAGLCQYTLGDLTGLASYSDNCQSGLTIVQNPAPGTLMDIGRHSIVMSVTDSWGNTGICSFDFVVLADASFEPIVCADSYSGLSTAGSSSYHGNGGCAGPNTPGGDKVFQLTVPTGNYLLEMVLDNVSDANENRMYAFWQKAECPITSCPEEAYTFNINNGTFNHSGSNTAYFSAPGPGTYYLILDSQINGIDNFDVSFNCVRAGVSFDVSGCTGDTDDNGYELSVNGGTDFVVENCETIDVCYDIWARNPTSWEWLDSVIVSMGSCYENPTSLTPVDGTTGWFGPGYWSENYDAASNNAVWDFFNTSNSAYGDGYTGSFSCAQGTPHLYQFCFRVDITADCANVDDLKMIIKIIDDGVGGSGATTFSGDIRIVEDISLQPFAVDAGADLTICENDSVQMAASGTGSFTWQQNGFVSDVNDFNTWVNPTTDTEFIIEGSNAYGCTQSDTVMVFINGAPVSGILGDPIFNCVEDTLFVDNIDASVSYHWTTDTGNVVSNPFLSSVRIDEDGMYYLTSENALGCISIDSFLTTADFIPPTFTLPPDVTLYRDGACLNDTSIALMLEPHSFSDNYFDGIASVSHYDIITDSCRGTYTIERQWSVADDCGATTIQSQFIHVLDTVGPSFTWPSDVIVYTPTTSCTADTSISNTGSNVTFMEDNCDPTPFFLDYFDVVTYDCGTAGYTVVRSWQVSDDCGNITTHNQNIFVRDTVPPTFVLPPSDTVYLDSNCFVDTTTTALGVPTAEGDNCGIVGYEDIDLSVYTVDDQIGQGNLNSESDQSVTIPFVYETGSDINSLQTIFEFGGATNGLHVRISSGNIEVIHGTNLLDLNTVISASVSSNTEYANILHRTAAGEWYLYMDIGNSTASLNYSHMIPGSISTGNLWDLDPAGIGLPFLLSKGIGGIFSGTAPSDPIDIYVGDDLSQYINAIGSTNTSTYEDLPDGCDGSYLLKRAWRLEDACGNVNIDTQFIWVLDTLKPTFTTPSDVTIYSDLNCTANVDTSGLAGSVSNEYDGCTDVSKLDATYLDVETIGNCDSVCIITREWRLSDDCGNVAIDTQYITIKDTISPVLTNAQDSIFLFPTSGCSISELPAFSGLSITNNCGPIDTTYTDVITNLGCPGNYVIERMWRIEDVAGNVDSALQVISVADTTKPSFTIPSDITVYLDVNCLANTDTSLTIGTVRDEYDGCSTGLDATFSDQIFKTCAVGSFVIERNWSLSDECGNTATGVQAITVLDTLKPYFTKPRDTILYTNLNCDAFDLSTSLLGEVTDETDNCSYSKDSGLDGALASANVALDITSASPSTPGTPHILNAISITGINTLVNGTYSDLIYPDGITTNFSTTQTGDVEVVQAGVSVASISDPDYTDQALLAFQSNDLQHFQRLDAHDFSTDSYTLYYDTPIPSNAGHFIMFTERFGNNPIQANAFDSSGNLLGSISVNSADYFESGHVANIHQDIELAIFPIDDLAPSGSLISSIRINLAGSAYDGPDGKVLIFGDYFILDASYTDNTIPSSCPGFYTVERTWSLVDACGNTTADQVQTITVLDTIKPTFTTPASITLYKDASCSVDASPSGLAGDVTDEDDNCATVLDAIYTDVATVGNCDSTCIIEREWVLSDACGNTTVGTQYITIRDTTSTTFDAPADVTIYGTSNCTIDTIGDPSQIMNIVNNCGPISDLEITYEDNITPTCTGTFEIERIWTITDLAGNASQETQMISVVDTVSPTFTVPSDITVYLDVNCAVDTDTSLTIGTVRDEYDGCSTGLDAIYTDSQTNTCAEGSYVITRTWSLSDDCGNTTTGVQQIEVLDTIRPTFTRPVDVVVYVDATCDVDTSPLGTGDVTDEDDNCTTALTASYASDTIPNCGGSFVILRTWSLVDACGNTTADQVQTITVLDTIKPIFTTPASITLYQDASCGVDDSPSGLAGDVTDEDDNCATVLDAIYTDVATVGNCDSTCIIEREWVLSDACGNTTVGTQYITIRDTTSTTFDAPADVTIYGTSNCTIDTIGDPSQIMNIVNNCGPISDLEITYADNITPTCTGTFDIERIWTITDVAGNASQETQMISVVDTVSPTFTLPSYITVYLDVNCAVDTDTSMTIGTVRDESDGCSTGLDATYVDAISNTCTEGSYVITRTWSLSDNCGNTSTGVQEIEVLDTIRPTFTRPIDATVYVDDNCVVDTSPLAVGDVTDENDNCATTLDATYVSDTTFNCTGSYVISRTWSLQDVCGNAAADQVQLITVLDTISPTFTTPASITLYKDVNCNVDAMPSGLAGDVTDELDNCTTTLNAIYTDIATVGNCDSTCIIEREWVLSDACGNTTVGTQYITIKDTTSTTFDAPMDVTVYGTADCTLDTIADPSQITNIVNNCSSLTDLEISYEDNITTTCTGTFDIERIWTITDLAGNTSQETQTITVVDTVSPTFTVPSDITVYLDANCAVDTDTSLTIGTVRDEYDGCSTGLDATFTDSETNTCAEGSYIITRTWSLSDDCGNRTTGVQQIEVLDTIRPTFTRPVDVVVYVDATCDVDTSPLGTGDVTDEDDNCTTALTASYASDTIPNCGGSYVILRTWSLVDACGNTAADQIQTITVLDTIKPTFTTPVSVTLYKDTNCNVNALPSGPAGDVTNEDDNCTALIDLDAMYTDIDTIGNCDSTCIIEREWVLSDACGNTTFGTQYITIRDTTSTTFDAPADVTIYGTSNCTIDTIGDPSQIMNIVNNCGPISDLEITYEDNITPTCTGTFDIERIWTITDVAGNVTEETQMISVVDTVSPTFTVPSDITVYLDANCAVDTDTSLTIGTVRDEYDGCSTGLDATYTDSETNTCAEGSYVITRTWSLSDDCGNTTMGVQQIEVLDTIRPTFTRPVDVTVYVDASCSVDTSPIAVGDVSDEDDNCTTTLEAGYVDAQVDNCAGSYVILRTWSLSDACGNAAADQVQTITVLDSIKPTFTTPASITLYKDASCSVDVLPSGLAGNVTDEGDNCTAVIDLDAIYTDIDTIGNCDSTCIIEREWVLSDGCGNTTVGTQFITVKDTTSTTFTAPSNVTIYGDANCIIDTIADPSQITGIVNNCNSITDLEITHADNITPTCAGTFEIERIWTITDLAGNTSQETQTITVVDTVSPTFTVPMDITVYLDANCFVDTDTSQAIGTVQDEYDGCSMNLDATYTDSQGNTCTEGSYIITRTWSLSDECGNTTTGVQQIEVLDTIRPTFTTPGNVVLYNDINCLADTSTASTGSVMDADDNCSSTPSVTHEDTITSTCGGTYTIERKWIIADNCGNENTSIQLIEVRDTIAPNFDAPSDVIVYLDDANQVDTATITLGSLTNTMDACGGITMTTYRDSAVAVNSNQILNDVFRIWTIVDECGNTSGHIQNLTLMDTIAPAYDTPSVLQIDCEYVPPHDTIAFTDINDVVSISMVETTIDTSCIDRYTLVRTWTAVDGVGNTSEVDQVYVVTSCNIILNAAISDSSPCSGEFVSLGGQLTHPTFNDSYYPRWYHRTDQMSPWTAVVDGDRRNIAFPAYETRTGEYKIIFDVDANHMGSAACQYESEIIYLNVQPEEPVTNIIASICPGTVYQFGDSSLGETGEYNLVYKNQNDCDSIITLTLEVYDVPATTKDIIICEGEFYETTSGMRHYTTGIYDDMLPSAIGCDSLLSINLTVLETERITVPRNICIGDSYEFDNMTLTESGSYVDTLTTTNGCDSIVTLDLLVTDKIYHDVSAIICKGSAYPFDGIQHTSSTNYETTYSSASGCDSVVIFNLEVVDEIIVTKYDTTCYQEPYTHGGITLMESDTIVENLQSVNGCDSMFILYLHMREEVVNTISVDICANDVYEYKNNIYNASQSFTEDLKTSTGCDSTVVFNFYVGESISHIEPYSMCSGDSLEVGAEYVKSAGTYSALYTSSSGCEDSTVTFQVDIVEAIQEEQEIVICSNDSIYLDGAYRKTSGTYVSREQSLITSCDSIMTTNLIVEESVELWTEDVNICLGESFNLVVDGADNIAWTNADALSCNNCPNPSGQVDQTTTFTATAQGCAGEDVSIDVTVTVFNEVEIEVLTPDTTLTHGETIVLDAFVSDPFVPITWYDELGNVLCSNCTQFEITADQNTVYYAEANGDSGCVVRDEVAIKVKDGCAEGEVTVPNFISPNADGLNDDIKIRYNAIQSISRMRVFNRWGSLIFKSDDVDNNRWDGTINGQVANAGVYVYFIEYRCLNGDDVVQKGNITIIK